MSLSKGAFFTDIHFGKKSNSDLHNQDCLDYLEWFCDSVKSDSTIQYIGFLGDWFENRSALNISTLAYAYRGMQRLNELGLPIFFVVGNHDLYRRHTREIYSVIPFHEFSNVTIIDTPTVIPEIRGGALFCPYLFHDEYADISTKYADIPFWAGHFEFKGFVVTGTRRKMETGPSHSMFSTQEAILSGHFHKRQSQDNIHYIGNTFPMDYGDLNEGGESDVARGLAIYDHVTHTLTYKDWDSCPRYRKSSLSTLLETIPNFKIDPKTRISVDVDVPIMFEEGIALRAQFMADPNVREFTMEETYASNATVVDEDEADNDTETDNVNLGAPKLETVDELVVKMLSRIEDEAIKCNTLIDIYNTL